MMKRILLLVLSALAAGAALPAAERPQVLAFGSSDACEWCRLLERRVFASEVWREWAAGHVEFLRVDLPRSDGMLPPDERARNNALADQLGVMGIPTFVVMAPDGKTELGRVKVPDFARGLERDMTPEAFIAAVEEVLAHNPPDSVAQERDPPVGEAPSRRFWRMYRFIPVVALLGFAAYLLVDKSKLPLALRGLKKVLGTSAKPLPSAAPPVPVWKRLLAFVLILVAFVLAIV